MPVDFFMPMRGDSFSIEVANAKKVLPKKFSLSH